MSTPKNITIGTQYASYQTGSRVVRAKVLDTDVNEQGKKVFYLDRLIHDLDSDFAGYSTSGAITTILTEL